MSSALEGGFLTTGPPGKSLEPVLLATEVCACLPEFSQIVQVGLLETKQLPSGPCETTWPSWFLSCRTGQATSQTVSVSTRWRRWGDAGAVTGPDGRGQLDRRGGEDGQHHPAAPVGGGWKGAGLLDRRGYVEWFVSLLQDSWSVFIWQPKRHIAASAVKSVLSPLLGSALSSAGLSHLSGCQAAWSGIRYRTDIDT